MVQPLVINPSGIPGIQGMVMDAASVAAGLPILERMLDTFTQPVAITRDSAASGGAFTTGELEYRNPKLYEPLMNVTWPRDIVSKTGGGFVDYTSNFFVDYATAGTNQYGLMGGATNTLPTIQGNVSKDLFPVNTFGYIVKVPFLDQQRLTQVGRSLEDILQNGLRVNYDKMLDWNTYFGMNTVGQTGLLNNPQVHQQFASDNGSGSLLWKDKTPVEILNDINALINLTWRNSEYDVTGMANHILIPPEAYTYINGTIISIGGVAGGQSILTFLLNNNIAKDRGIDLRIEPCRQCVNAGEPAISGTLASGRMMAYVNREDRVHFDETVPLTRILTQPSAEQVAYLTTYIAKVGVVKFLFFQCAAYMDGITAYDATEIVTVS